MKLYLNQFASHLASQLAPVYLVGGDEPLLVDECCAAIRDRAIAQGYTDREVLNVETGFDWNKLSSSGQSLSLFGGQRLLELRLPTGRPGDAGAKALTSWTEDLPEDTVLLVIAGKLDQDILRTKWAKSLEKAGAVLRIFPPEPGELPGWITQRMRKQGLQADKGVAEQLAYHFEGNLLALSQEISKMALSTQGAISVADLEDQLNDSARFSVFRLVDVCLQGDASNVQRILGRLEKEGVAPVLVLWALVREIRSLATMAQEIAGGRHQSEVFKAHRVWAKRQGLLKKGLDRLRPGQWLTLLQRASRTDRVIKGRAMGNKWQELEGLGLAICGVVPLAVR
ncbi:MAG: DNA polymerase III subunit delta [Gammaproteobacteria bacterium]|nr:MAG: DNA polymerase III subunit delta [Gammaproteobacteria bacterium]